MCTPGHRHMEPVAYAFEIILSESMAFVPPSNFTRATLQNCFSVEAEFKKIFSLCLEQF